MPFIILDDMKINFIFIFIEINNSHKSYAMKDS